MPGFLRQSTDSQSRVLGPFIDDTDFKSPATGLTIANTDIKLVVNGAASVDKNSGGGTHRVNGNYGVTFDATDTATVGELQVSVKVAGALEVFDKFTVIEEAVYDLYYAASATALTPANITQIDGGATAAANLELAFESGPGYIRKNTAQAGAAGTITLDASASAIDDFYNGTLVLILSGTGALQARVITDYVGATKVATVATSWLTNPANDSVFIILASGSSIVDANIISIGDSTDAADNLLTAFNGGSYNVGGGAINVSNISGDVAALATEIPDSTPADGTRPTIQEGILMITRFLTERSVSGLTMTVTKEDGTTGVMTFTLNSATAPTSITRAS